MTIVCKKCWNRFPIELLSSYISRRKSCVAKSNLETIIQKYFAYTSDFIFQFDVSDIPQMFSVSLVVLSEARHFQGCFHGPADKWWPSITCNCLQNVGMSWGKYRSRPLDLKSKFFLYLNWVIGQSLLNATFCGPESMPHVPMIVNPG